MSTLSSSQLSLIIGSCVSYGAVAFVFAIAIKCFYLVSKEEAIVIERLGRFHRILTSGIHFVIPLLDAPRIIMWRSSALNEDGKMTDDNHNFFRIDLRECLFNFLPQEVMTNDGVLLDVNVVLRYKVSDVEKMVYETDDLMSALVNTAQGHIREVFSNLSCAVAVQNQKEICKMLESEFKPIFSEWGVLVTGILFSQLMPSEATRETLVAQITAEHRKRGSAIKAEGRKTAMRLQAEGAKITRLNMGLAEQEATRKISEGDAAALVDLARAESSALHTLASTMRTDGASNIDYMIALRCGCLFAVLLHFFKINSQACPGTMPVSPFCYVSRSRSRSYMDTINAVAQSKSSGHQFVLPYESQSLRGLIKALPKVYGRNRAGVSKVGRRANLDS
jgi:regulator of protease activity HflC (stomatin/prohibitin superfamily)